MKKFQQDKNGVEIGLKFTLLTYFHVDSGANIHIVTCQRWLVNYRRVTSAVEVVGGVKKKVEVIGDLPCMLCGRFFLLSNVCHMPSALSA